MMEVLLLHSMAPFSPLLDFSLQNQATILSLILEFPDTKQQTATKTTVKTEIKMMTSSDRSFEEIGHELMDGF
jgi:hypothetical protein